MQTNIIWFKITTTEKRFKITFPLPFFIFEELLYSFLDVMDVASIFIKSSRPARDMIRATLSLLSSLTDTQTYDLVHVQADKVEILIRLGAYPRRRYEKTTS